MLCFFLPLFLPMIRGFLIDKPHNYSGNPLVTSQYVTEAEFLKETTFIHQEAGQIRTFVDKALAVLTSQLPPKFDILDQLQQKIEHLEHTLLKYENHSESTLSLEQKYTDLEQKYNNLKFDYNLMKLDLDNKTTELNQKIADIKQLDNIKPLAEFKTLQQTVQAVSAQTHSLSINEQARSQDFLALYNMTMDSKRKLSELKQNTSTQFKRLELNTNKQLNGLEQTQNKTADDIISKLQDFEKYGNLTFNSMEEKIIKNGERVVMTAQSSSLDKFINGVIIFNVIKYSTGITNLLSFKNTGKFTCETEGVYIISVSLMSYTSGANYYIMVNGVKISRTYIASHSNSYDYTGTVTYTLQLHLNDKVWLSTAMSCYIYGGLWSTLTIIKIK